MKILLTSLFSEDMIVGWWVDGWMGGWVFAWVGMWIVGWMDRTVAWPSGWLNS